MTTTLATSVTAAEALSTSHWNGPAPGPWWVIFPILWFLFIVALFSTLGFLGRRRWRTMNAYAGQRAGESRLAERYAAGEIEDHEYERRLATIKRLGSS